MAPACALRRGELAKTRRELYVKAEERDTSCFILCRTQAVLADERGSYTSAVHEDRWSHRIDRKSGGKTAALQTSCRTDDGAVPVGIGDALSKMLALPCGAGSHIAAARCAGRRFFTRIG